MLPGAGGGGGMLVGEATPQIDDARIIIHNYKAPGAPQSNILRTNNPDVTPQYIDDARVSP